MAEQSIGLKEIELTTGIPNSSLRWYAQSFSEFMPVVSQGGKGRALKLKPEAIEVFKVIRVAFDQGKSKGEIREELARRFPINLAPDQPDQLPALHPSPGEDLVNRLTEALEVIADQREEIRRLSILLAHHEDRLKALEAKPTSTPWWKRVFRG